MELKRIDCPLMKNFKGDSKKCDDYHWEIRKFFPNNFQCWEKDECVIMKLAKNSPEYEFMCKFRENCIWGDICPGHNGNICTLKDEILPKKQKNNRRRIILPSLAKKLAELFS